MLDSILDFVSNEIFETSQGRPKTHTPGSFVNLFLFGVPVFNEFFILHLDLVTTSLSTCVGWPQYQISYQAQYCKAPNKPLPNLCRSTKSGPQRNNKRPVDHNYKGFHLELT